MIKSEIRNGDGTYTKDAIALSTEFERAIEELKNKYKDKLSYDAMITIMFSIAYSSNTFQIAMEAEPVPEKEKR